MPENRFLVRFCSVLGAATLVCSTHLFLLATWKWDLTAPPAIELSHRSQPAEPVAELEIARPPVFVSTKDQLAGSEVARQIALAPSVEKLDTSGAMPRFTASLEEQVQVALEDGPHVTAEAHVGNPASPALASADVSIALKEQPHLTYEARVEDQTPPLLASATLAGPSPIAAEAGVGNEPQPAPAIGRVSLQPEEQPHVTAEALIGTSTDVSAEAATNDKAAHSRSAADVMPSSSAENAEGESADGPPMQDAAVVRKSLQRLVLASSPLKADIPEPQRLKPQTIRSIRAATHPQDSDQADGRESIAIVVQNPQQSSLKVLPRQASKPSVERAQAKSSTNSKPPKLAAKGTQHDQTSQLGPLPKPTGSSPGDKPLPSLKQIQRKPRELVIAAKEKPAPKLLAKPTPRQTESSQITPRWKPMALAPAEKPSRSLTQSQTKKTDARGYSANIWSALARKKPNAGQRGSTTVTFAIGPAGALRFVRVSRSSGNARLDQLALATVRTAAPFPPPPVSAAAAYTIRIDLH